jgi:para-aminobenzoate synthetase component 1
MIVDLERNDLGRVQFRTVQVPGCFVWNNYATVWHLVSTVQSRLSPFKQCGCVPGAFPADLLPEPRRSGPMEIIGRTVNR